MRSQTCLKHTFGAFGGSESLQIVAKSCFFQMKVKTLLVFPMKILAADLDSITLNEYLNPKDTPA